VLRILLVVVVLVLQETEVTLQELLQVMEALAVAVAGQEHQAVLVVQEFFIFFIKEQI
jgi:hypothetical protein